MSRRRPRYALRSHDRHVRAQHFNRSISGRTIKAVHFFRHSFTGWATPTPETQIAALQLTIYTVPVAASAS